MNINITVDPEADAAYVSLCDRPVARTVEFDAATTVDLDEFGMVVGIEVLGLRRDWPLAAVADDDRFHVETNHADALRNIHVSPVDVAEQGRRAATLGPVGGFVHSTSGTLVSA